MQPIGESAFPQKEEKFLGGPHFLKKIQENSETSFSLSRPVEV
jgi:hypothetical protein